MFVRALLQSLPFSKHLERSYGGKRPALRAAKAWLRWKSGELLEYSEVDWSRVDRVVYVCLGNICRSPYGDALTQAQGVASASCGLEALADEAANPVAKQCAAQRGTSLEAHKARRFDDFDWTARDLAVVFEIEQAQEVKARLSSRFPHSPLSRPQIALLGLWTQPPRPHIQDPYSLSKGYFETCYSLIENAVAKLLSERSSR